MATVFRSQAARRLPASSFQPLFLLRLKPGARYVHSRRRLHESNPTQAAATSLEESVAANSTSGTPTESLRPPLSILPFGTLLRSYLITTLSSSPLLLNSSMQMLSVLARSKSALLSPDRNPVLRCILKKTFYAQFCAGETAVEVRQVVKGIKSIGFSGVILGHAREVVLKKGETVGEEGSRAERSVADVDRWRQGTLETLVMMEEGDEVALKFTGAGRQALHALQESLPPSKLLEEAIVEICELAKTRKVRLLFDAEQHSLQAGIDAWTMDFQERYNQDIPGQALVYGTYQAYKRSTPTILAEHLSTAMDKGFTLGVKLVRGAYLGSDPRHLFWSRKEETDDAYDELAEALMRRTYGNRFRPVHEKENGGFPQVNLVLATHNLDTVKKAIKIRNDQLVKGGDRIPLIYAQLQGMADNVSCELVHAGKLGQGLEQARQKSVEAPQVHKYLVWGTVGECLTYLLRRAQENKDTVTRTEKSRLALRSELGRRVFGA